MVDRKLLTECSHEDEEKENAIAKCLVGLEPAGQVVQTCGRRQMDVSTTVLPIASETEIDSY
jgi:hypothetical protein